MNFQPYTYNCNKLVEGTEIFQTSQVLAKSDTGWQSYGPLKLAGLGDNVHPAPDMVIGRRTKTQTNGSHTEAT